MERDDRDRELVCLGVSKDHANGAIRIMIAPRSATPYIYTAICKWRFVRVAARADTLQTTVEEQLARTFQVTRSSLCMPTTSPRRMVAHELNAPFGDDPIYVYHFAVQIERPRPVRHFTLANPDICLVDFVPNTESGCPRTDISVTDADLLLAEAEYMGVTKPCYVRIKEDVDGSARTLGDRIEVVGPVPPEELVASRLGVVYAAYSSAETHPSLHGLGSGAPSGGKVREPPRFLSHGDAQRPAILFVPARDYARRSEIVSHIEAHYVAVVCYEKVLTQIYGKYYMQRVAGGIYGAPSLEQLEELQRIVVAIAYYTGSSIADACSGSQIRIAHCLLQKMLAESNFLPPPRWKRASGEKHGRDDDEEEESGYRGGFILDVNPRLHQTPVMMFDFNSHYPASIAEFDILPRARSRSKTASHSPAAALKALIALKRSASDPMERRAIKLALVSYYGSTGSAHSPIYSRRLAAETTRKCREMLDLARAALAERCNDNVVFGHTDSVAVLCDSEVTANEVTAEFNARYENVRLELEHTFSTCWLLNRTTYFGVREGGTRVFEDICTKIVEGLRGFADADAPESLEEFLQVEDRVQRMFCAVLLQTKKAIVAPGLVSGSEPIRMNMLGTLVATLCLGVWEKSLSLEYAERMMTEAVETFDFETDAISTAEIPLWCYTFPIAERAKAARKNSPNAILSGKVWDQIARQRDLKDFEALRAIQDTLHVHAILAPDGELQLVDAGPVSVGKQHWLARFLRRWDGYVSNLLESDPVDVPRRILAIARKYCVAGANTRRSGPAGTRKNASSKSPAFSSVTLGIVPQELLDMRQVAYRRVVRDEEWPEFNASYAAAADAVLTRIVTQIADPVARNFAVSLLFERLDVVEAVRRCAPSCASAERYAQESGAKPFLTTYDKLLASFPGKITSRL